MKKPNRTAGEIIFLRKFRNSMAQHPDLIRAICAYYEVDNLEDLTTTQLSEVKAWTEMFWPVLYSYSFEIDRLRGNRNLTMKPRPMSC